MIAFLSLPIGAVLVLLLHLLKVGRRMLVGVFFAAITISFACALGEMILGAGTYTPGAMFRIDDFTRFFILIFTGVTALGAVAFIQDQKYSAVSESTQRSTEIILTLLLLAPFAMTLVAAATSVLALFLSMEFLAIAFYELVALEKNRIGMEAAIKFFVVGVFSSLLFLLGAAFYYGATGTGDFTALQGIGASPFLVASLVLMFAGIGFKMSVFPLNLWLPDVYQGAPGSITAILAGAAKKAGFAAYLRLFIPLTLPVLSLSLGMLSWQLLIGICAAATMLFGVIAAAVQQDVKRMIAYSIISHAGFLALGLATGTQFGYRAVLLHAIIHALMATGIFIMIAELERNGIRRLDDYTGMAAKNFWFSMAFALFLASLIGLPPLAGFLSKFLLFSSTVEAGMMWLVIMAVIASVISSYFYFVVLRRMFAYAPAADSAVFISPGILRKIPWLVPAILLIIFGFYPQPLLQLIGKII
ncbi:MAG: NADH-quinone oxidoreductase subunit N [bacterium]|nr:NADH-quinone oxidoreductase subunit N [bacterium]